MRDEKLDFNQVYDKFKPRIYRYLSRLIGIKEAEDLAQDVFLKIFGTLSSFKKQSRLSTWIYRIATNAAIDRMRSSSFKQEARETSILAETDLNENAGRRRRSVEDQLMRGEMNDCIRVCVARLPENLRTILVLSEIEGLKNNEIAEIAGLSPGAVKIRLHRARTKLKDMLISNCNFYRTECCASLACELKKTSSEI